MCIIRLVRIVRIVRKGYILYELFEHIINMLYYIVRKGSGLRSADAYMNIIDIEYLLHV